MNIHENSKSSLALPLHQLPASLHADVSEEFSVAYPPMRKGRDADLCFLLSEWPRMDIIRRSPGTRNNRAVAHAMNELKAAASAHALGHTFVIDAAKNLTARDLITRTPQREVMKTLGAPFEVTPIIVTLGSVPTLFVQRGDAAGRQLQITVASLCEDNGAPGIALRAWINLQQTPSDVPGPVVTRNMARGEILSLGGLAAMARTLLLLISDNRMPAKRDAPGEINAQHWLRQDKQRLPPIWPIDVSQSQAIYTTKLSVHREPDRKGDHAGRHASPCAHDRRGHPRRLRSGRTIWVKACRIGWQIGQPRRRDRYEINADIGRKP